MRYDALREIGKTIARLQSVLDARYYFAAKKFPDEQDDR